MPEEAPRQGDRSAVGWGLAVLAGVILIILLGWGFGGNGHGWGRNEMAHMMPPAAGVPATGPATRNWTPGNR